MAVELEEGLIIRIAARVVVEAPTPSDMAEHTSLVFIASPESHDLAAILHVLPGFGVHVRIFSQGRYEFIAMMPATLWKVRCSGELQTYLIETHDVVLLVSQILAHG